MNEFDPNEACAPNGHFFGFPFSEETSPLILIPVPWDVTASYRKGAARGPQAILDASIQLDFFDFEIADAWKAGIGTSPFEDSLPIGEVSGFLRPVAERAIAYQEKQFSRLPVGYNSASYAKDLSLVEKGGEKLNEWLKLKCEGYLKQGKRIGIVGGDHSVPLGLLQALAGNHGRFGILHLDAHADLRNRYEGFLYSHASIMYNALKIPNVTKLVQVGIRDICEAENEICLQSGGRIVQFPDVRLQKELHEGRTWRACCEEILSALPRQVYVSFDIDALDPALCPHTGTPVPGGLSFGQARYLLSCLRQSGKEIIGFDLCEVAPDSNNPGDEWDGNVGARILYLLSNTLLFGSSAQSE